MRRTFSKGLVVGAVLGAGLLGATSAMAGTGVGGVFHLGKENTVGKVTTLTKTGPGAALRIRSQGPPLKVSSEKRVDKLNADRLDGRSSSELVRMGESETTNATSGSSFSNLQTLVVEAPAAGYVLVSSSTTGWRNSCPDGCSAIARVHHVESDTYSPLMMQSAVATMSFAHLGNLSVMPVSPGANTFVFQTATSPVGSFSFYDSTLTGIFVPFDAMGAPVTAVSGRQEAPTPGGPVVEQHR